MMNIFTLNALSISTSEVSMFKLAIEVCFENHFGLSHDIFLSLGSKKSGYFFGTPGTTPSACILFIINSVTGNLSWL